MRAMARHTREAVHRAAQRVQLTTTSAPSCCTAWLCTGIRCITSSVLSERFVLSGPRACDDTEHHRQRPSERAKIHFDKLEKAIKTHQESEHTLLGLIDKQIQYQRACAESDEGQARLQAQGRLIELLEQHEKYNKQTRVSISQLAYVVMHSAPVDEAVALPSIFNLSCLPTQSVSLVEELSRLVQRSLDESMGLAEQQLSMPGLAKPWPRILVRGSSTVRDQIAYSMLYIDRASSCLKDFVQAVKVSVQDPNPKNNYMILVTQTKGAGKTKLSVDASLREGLPAIILTPATVSGDLALPFKELKLYLYKYEDYVDSEGIHGLEKLRGLCFQVLIGAYIEWAAAVLRELAVTDQENGRGKRSLEQTMMALQLSLRIDKATTGVAEIVKRRLEAIQHMEFDVLEQQVRGYVRNARDALLASISECADEPLCSTNPLLITLDNAQQFAFEFSGSEQPNEVESLEWIGCAARGLLDQRIAVAYVGTHFDANVFLQYKMPASCKRASVFSKSEFITTAIFWGVLRSYLPSLPQAPPSCLSGLGVLEGRPKFFFDALLLPALVTAFRDYEEITYGVCPDVTCKTAQRLIAALHWQIPVARDSTVSSTVWGIGDFASGDLASAQGPEEHNEESGRLIRSLLSGVYLDGGELQTIRKDGRPSSSVDIDAMRDGVKHGVFNWDPVRDTDSVMQEPVVIEAVQAVGYTVALRQRAENDVMLKYWSADISTGSAPIGRVLENAVAWALLRACARGPVSLLGAMQRRSSDILFNDVVQCHLDELRIDVRRAAPVKMTTSNGKLVDDWSCTYDVHTVWHSFSEHSGMHVFLRSVSGIPIGIHVNADAGSFADAVASCTMGWQGLSRKPKTRYTESPARSSLLDSESMHSDLPHIRLVVSANGYTKGAIKAAVRHNLLHPESAILPCLVDRSIFGPLASSIENGKKSHDVSLKLALDVASDPADRLLSQPIIKPSEFCGRGMTWEQYLASKQS